jgi:UDP-N-acetylmuramoyl-tripeptide--D-alanyl-D-alanine ligase
MEWRQAGDSVEFAVATPAQEVAGAVPGVGGIQARNAAVAIAAAEAAGVDARLASGALKGVKFPGKRMEILQRNGMTIWLDAYNSSPESCEIALRSFADLRVPGRKFAILGDMLELGEFSESEHRRIGEVAAGVGLFELALVGELAEHIGAGARDAGFDGETSFHPDAEAASAVLERTGSGDAVLIKGSRGIGLERVLETPDA